MTISTGLPSTLTTEKIYASLRKIALQYAISGVSLLTLVSDREVIYIARGPTPPAFPYITFLLTRTSLKEYNGYRETWDLEAQFHGRPESQLPLIEQMADLVDGAFNTLTLSTAGLVVGRNRVRSTLPMYPTPADINVVSVLCRYSLFAWPAALTRLRPN